MTCKSLLRRLASRGALCASLALPGPPIEGLVLSQVHAGGTTVSRLGKPFANRRRTESPVLSSGWGGLALLHIDRLVSLRTWSGDSGQDQGVLCHLINHLSPGDGLRQTSSCLES
ncbi:hypothetical protein PGT21_014501 [Puccinia graminis f. sp. tritici]|uniref:Uncharacterized protein n=1 Tax=Puccinia graminis f. sp. tritici TaxID=56615 RepID=A0A5B0NCA2_PUCGR|nr:hypothetical protein PGT21_014501 [Puccinia graminis f. sp. tritici]